MYDVEMNANLMYAYSCFFCKSESILFQLRQLTVVLNISSAVLKKEDVSFLYTANILTRKCCFKSVSGNVFLLFPDITGILFARGQHLLFVKKICFKQAHVLF